MIFQEKDLIHHIFPGQKLYADVIVKETYWLGLTAMLKNKMDEQVYGHRKPIQSDECDH